jgi:YVTN family beta-propeller protein
VSRSTFILCVATALVAGGTVAGVLSVGRTGHTVHPRTGADIIVPGPDKDGRLLHNGWRLTPAGRATVQTGDMLLGGGVSPDGKLLAIANAGFNAHAIHIVDLATEKEVVSVPVSKTWNGLAWASDSRRIYFSGGISNTQGDVHLLTRFDNGEWGQQALFSLYGVDRNTACVSGLALSPDDRTLYVLNNTENRLYIVEADTGAGLARIEIGDHPVVARVAKDGRTLYVANWGGSEVAVVDVADPRAPTIVARLQTGAHPNDLALTKDGRLFVSAGNADEVNVFDVATRQPLETIKTTLTPKSAQGSTPNAVALTPDERLLFVANADNNDVVVIDVATRGHSAVRGFIPSAWYPTAVHATPDGKRLIVGSGKGMGTGPTPVMTPIDPNAPIGFSFHGNLLSGNLAFVDLPDEAQLAAYTKQVYANTPYRDELRLAPPPPTHRTAIPSKVGEPSPIKHVLYIIKENRSYDQVLGDIERGNGDPRLTLFGREVTPNHHALAEEFVLLDNLYCNAEVSVDGHRWSTSAYVTDFVQRTWVWGASRRGSIVAAPSVARPPSGFIWEAVLNKGLKVMGYYALHPTLAPHITARYKDYTAKPVGDMLPRDTTIAALFIEDFKEFERTKTMPDFIIMGLGEDHTNGTQAGGWTPKAAVGSNDLALGQIVSAISHSSYWKDFAIFVIEDDSQNGPDSVDSHRTVGLVVSPYARRQHVDSTMYTTTSMLRTMELILGLPPLTQHDGGATPMFESFTDKATLTPYELRPARIDLNSRNTENTYGAKQSARMDWSEYDRIDEDTLNRILWHSIKGPDVPMPAPVRRAIPMADGRMHRLTDPNSEEDEEDEEAEGAEEARERAQRRGSGAKRTAPARAQ